MREAKCTIERITAIHFARVRALIKALGMASLNSSY